MYQYPEVVITNPEEEDDPDEEEEEEVVVNVPDDEEEEIVFDFTGPINPKRQLAATKSKRRELKYIKKVEKLKEYQLLQQQLG